MDPVTKDYSVWQTWMYGDDGSCNKGLVWQTWMYGDDGSCNKGLVWQTWMYGDDGSCNKGLVWQTWMYGDDGACYRIVNYTCQTVPDVDVLGICFFSFFIILLLLFFSFSLHKRLFSMYQTLHKVKDNRWCVDLFGQWCKMAPISRVLNQNGISHAPYIVHIYHSGPEPERYISSTLYSPHIPFWQWCNMAPISRVPNQNAISQAPYIVHIYHSGPEPSVWRITDVLISSGNEATWPLRITDVVLTCPGNDATWPLYEG